MIDDGFFSSILFDPAAFDGPELPVFSVPKSFPDHPQASNGRPPSQPKHRTWHQGCRCPDRSPTLTLTIYFSPPPF